MSRNLKIFIGIAAVIIIVCMIFLLKNNKNDNENQTNQNTNASTYVDADGVEMKVKPDGKSNSKIIDNLKNITSEDPFLRENRETPIEEWI